MMSDYKQRVERAMARYHARQFKKDNPKPPQRQNDKPEEKLVAKPCRTWMKKQGWHVNPIEAKSVWSKTRNMWVASHVRPGTPDCNATDGYGFACWVEFKAPGKLSTVWANTKQVDFINAQINRNAFACIVDSAQLLETIYETWLNIRMAEMDGNKAQDYLRSMIPRQPKRRDDDKPLFDENEI